MNTAETSIPEALRRLAQALHNEDRKQISSAMKACRQVLDIKGTDEELSAIAMVFFATDAGQSPISVASLRGASTEDFRIHIRWEIVINSLIQKGVISLQNEEPITQDQPHCTAIEKKIPSQNAPVPLDHCSIILQPAYCDAEGRNVIPEGFESNRIYITACIDFLDAYTYNIQSHKDQPTTTSEALDSKYAHLRMKARCTDPLPPLEFLCKAYELIKVHWLIILLVLKNEVSGDTSDASTAEGLLQSGNLLEQYEFRQLFAEENVLMRTGIIIQDESYRKGKDLISMPTDLVHWLITGQGDPPTQIMQEFEYGESKPFENNNDYVVAWHDLAKAFIESFEGGQKPRVRRYTRLEPSPPPAIEIPQVRKLVQELIERGNKFPLGMLIRKHQLDFNECIIVAMGIYARTRDVSIPMHIAIEIIAGNDPILHLQHESYFMPEARLMSSGMLELVHADRGGACIKLSEPTMSQILEMKSNSTVAKSSSPLYESRKPRHDLSSVVLSKELQQTIDHAIGSTTRGMIERMKQWGINQITATRPAGSLTMLLHGDPGTGKTFLAEAIAGSLNRDLFIVDAERIVSMWHGESEHNLQRVFDQYDNAVRTEEIAPIMLINECDQLLSDRSRMSGSTSVDMTEMRLQSSLLQNFERFQGILIGTTNLPEQDRAYERRWDYKLHLPMPDVEARLALWQVHIPDTVPRAPDVDLQYISKHFHLSGGQIANAVSNSLKSAVHRGDCLTMEDIMHACKAELNSNFEHRSRNEHPIGFLR